MSGWGWGLGVPLGLWWLFCTLYMYFACCGIFCYFVSFISRHERKMRITNYDYYNIVHILREKRKVQAARKCMYSKFSATCVHVPVPVHVLFQHIHMCTPHATTVDTNPLTIQHIVNIVCP